MQKIKKLIKKPYLIITYLARRGFLNWIPDELYLKWIFFAHLGFFPDLKNPRTFNEKLNWLKLNDCNDLYTKLVDKAEVKKIIGKTIGEKYVIPTIGVWNSVDEIDFDKLPEKFVLKCTHDSQSVIICKNKNQFDVDQAKKKLKKCLKFNLYWGLREWPYKNVKPRIIAEQFLEDSLHSDLMDYKFFCFNGIPRIVLLCSDRFSGNGLKEDFYDENWNHLPIRRPNHGNSSNAHGKPLNFDLMLQLAKRISHGLKFVRVDLFEVNGLVYFGETTFFPSGGLEGFEPENWDLTLGGFIDLDS